MVRNNPYVVRLGFLLIKHRRGGRSVAPQDELHHPSGHDPLKTVRIPEEHLERPLERRLWLQKAEMYPQKYPRYPQQDARSRMAISDSCQSQPDGLHSTCQAVRCSNLEVLAVIRFNRPRKPLPCRSRSNQRAPVKSAAPAESLIRPVPVNGPDLANNPGRIRRHWR